MLKIKNKSDKAAEIYISGAIVDDAEGDFLATVWDVESGYEWPAKIRQQLEEIKGKDLTIYINSDGGVVPAGVAIANMIARHDGHTTAVVDGWCCSIATQIFFAADERRMPSNAYLMIHKPACSVYGNSDDLLKTADVLDTIQEGLETTYRKAALDGVTDEQIHDMVEAETWLTGAEAAEVFDIQLTEPLKAVACVGKVHTKHVPENIKLAPPPVDEAPGNDDEAEADIEIALALAKGALL